jgi:hypoxanthine phosphoribosyltransferase
MGLTLNWPTFAQLATGLATDVARDGLPQALVGVLRGGMVPTILLAHTLGLRTVRAVEVTHTSTDDVGAAKTEVPVVVRPDTLGDLAGMDVLIVDDIAGTGDTMTVAATLARQAGADRVRTLACVVNETNWRKARTDQPGELLTYIGMVVQGWVIFPWERR